MTSVTMSVSSSPTRVWRVVRMQLVNRQTFVWVPLIILAGSFVLSLAVFLIIPARRRSTAWAHRRPCGTSSLSASSR